MDGNEEKKIQQQEKEVWVSQNPGKEVLEKFPHFKKRLNAEFQLKDK